MSAYDCKGCIHYEDCFVEVVFGFGLTCPSFEDDPEYFDSYTDQDDEGYFDFKLDENEDRP